MEFCPRCQEIKPFSVQEFYGNMIKQCRDCNFTLGNMEISELNILINELNFYKYKYYSTELESIINWGKNNEKT